MSIAKRLEVKSRLTTAGERTSSVSSTTSSHKHSQRLANPIDTEESVLYLRYRVTGAKQT